MEIFTSKANSEVTEDAEKKVKFEFITQLLQLFYQLNNKQKWLIISIPLSLLFLLLITLLVLINHQQNTVNNMAGSESKQSLKLLHELRDIDNQLQTLSTSPQNSENFKNALATVNSDLTHLQKSINDIAKTADIQKVSSQIASMKEDVDSQILDLKRTVAGSQDTKQYLDAKILPFHVISIDVISQQPFVSINYANHITPFAIGDTIAGWQIVAADYDAAQAEFKNDKDQYVKVALQG